MMFKIKKQFILIGSFIVLFLVASYWYLNNIQGTSSLVEVEQIIQDKIDLTQNAVVTAKTFTVTQQELRYKELKAKYPSAPEEILRGLSRSKEERDKIRHKYLEEKNIREKWEYPRGLLVSEQDLYREFDNESLRGLASQGDTYAMDALGTELIFDKKYKQSFNSFMVAAVHGSINSLQEIGSYINIMVEQGIHEPEVIASLYGSGFKFTKGNEKQGLILLSAAYYTVAQFRGEVEVNSDMKKMIIEDKILKRDFTEQEKKTIHRLASTIYKRLSKVRQNKGLPAFDNSYSPNYAKQYGGSEENKFMEEQTRFYGS